jgi:hypothetical protein
MSESQPENVRLVANRHHQRFGYFVRPQRAAFILLMYGVAKKFQSFTRIYSRADIEPPANQVQPLDRAARSHLSFKFNTRSHPLPATSESSNHFRWARLSAPTTRCHADGAALNPTAIGSCSLSWLAKVIAKVL